MKKLLLASTALVLSVGVAAAEVRVSGEGRMGILKGFGDFAGGDDPDIGFTSRIRIAFAGSGQTDGGLTFGGVIRADNAPGGNNGTDGSVFISGAFGRLTMGDVGGAAEAAVRDVSGVGLTEPGGFIRETTYVSNIAAGVRSAMRYDYSFGAFGVHVSADNPAGPTNTYSVAASYSEGGLRAGIGYERGSIDGGTVVNLLGGNVAGVDTLGADTDIDHFVLGGEYTFGAVTLKANYGVAEIEDDTGFEETFTQYGLSVDYVIDALTLTAYYRYVDLDELDVNGEAIGVGAAYNLGGGASVRGGYTQVTLAGETEDAYDFGVRFEF